MAIYSVAEDIDREKQQRALLMIMSCGKLWSGYASVN